MWPYSWTHVGTFSHLGHIDRVAATMPSQAQAGAAQEAPDIGQWEGQDVPLVRPSSCIVKGGIPSSRRYLPTYLHASRVRRARPQWTIQVYNPPRAWPFSTWAVLAVMWHLAPEDAPTGTADEIAWDLDAWLVDQDFPWRRPQGGLPVAPAAEGFSLAATLQQHPDKRARHFLQTGTALAAPPDSEWRWDGGGGAQPLPDPWILPLWYLPTGTLVHAAQAVKGAFP